MIFPSLFANIDTGLVSQVSVYSIIIFAFVINKMKKIFISLCLILLTITIYNHAFAAMAAPGHCGSMCMSNRNYYGMSYGQAPPVYYWPTMPFHALYGPTNYYYRPYPPSPYQPVNCVECMMQYQRYTQPIFTGGSGLVTQVKNALLP